MVRKVITAEFLKKIQILEKKLDCRIDEILFYDKNYFTFSKNVF